MADISRPMTPARLIAELVASLREFGVPHRQRVRIDGVRIIVVDAGSVMPWGSCRKSFVVRAEDDGLRIWLDGNTIDDVRYGPPVRHVFADAAGAADRIFDLLTEPDAGTED